MTSLICVLINPCLTPQGVYDGRNQNIRVVLAPPLGYSADHLVLCSDLTDNPAAAEQLDTIPVLVWNQAFVLIRCVAVAINKDGPGAYVDGVEAGKPAFDGSVMSEVADFAKHQVTHLRLFSIQRVILSDQ